MDAIFTNDTSKIPNQYISLVEEIRKTYLSEIIQSDYQTESKETGSDTPSKITNEDYLRNYMIATFKIGDKVEALYRTAKDDLDHYNEQHPITHYDFLGDIIHYHRRNKKLIRQYENDKKKQAEDPIEIERKKKTKVLSECQTFQAIPLRTSYVPSYFHIDTKGLKYMMNFSGFVNSKFRIR